MKSDLAPIVPDSQRLLREIVATASAMPKNYKWLLGGKLLDAALDSLLLAQDAFRLGRQPLQALPLVERLVKLNDGIQALLQVAYDLKAISSSGRLDELARLAKQVGRQGGGWLAAIKARHPKGQSPAAHAPPGSPGTLSTHGASNGAQR